MVPVLDSQKKPLMPCSEKRARQMLERKQACVYWKNGFFCIILKKEPSNRLYQKVVAGVDPGSKREGYTIATKKRVVLNVLSDTPGDVKDAIETRRNLRRARRARKCPYRKCRFNRKIGQIPPSTRARWGAKLRIINMLHRLIPITDINVEDIKARTRQGCRKWNVSFSPLEVGKIWFYGELKKGFNLTTTQGFETALLREKYGYAKTKEKLRDTWDAHCVDSHVLCTEVLRREIKPFLGMYKINFFKFSRRQLHVQNPTKGGNRKQYGGTISLDIPRGALVKSDRHGIAYVGGTSKGKLSLHDIRSGKRLTQGASCDMLTIITTLKWRSQFIPGLKPEVSLRKR
jgi:hypothetical protein